MNPWGLIILGLGFILIYIGWKGSQHSVVNSFKGIRGGGGKTPASPPRPVQHPATPSQTQGPGQVV